MPVDQDGRVDIEELDRVMQQFKDTLGMVSIMAVNNEIVIALILCPDIAIKSIWLLFTSRGICPNA